MKKVIDTKRMKVTNDRTKQSTIPKQNNTRNNNSNNRNNKNKTELEIKYRQLVSKYPVMMFIPTLLIAILSTRSIFISLIVSGIYTLIINPNRSMSEIIMGFIISVVLLEIWYIISKK